MALVTGCAYVLLLSAIDDDPTISLHFSVFSSVRELSEHYDIVALKYWY